MEEININNVSEVILQEGKLRNGHINSIQKLLSNPDLQKIGNDYEANKTEMLDEGFSVFKIVSDLYYREKFHSQIIASFLNPQEKHNEGNKLLNIFLEYLNKAHGNKCSINKNAYQNAGVTGTKGIGEKKQIDIWIKGSGRCIIIENKINNAVDQYLQIPRYWDDAKKAGYDVDAIIYLSLDGKKSNADKNNWWKLDKSQKTEIENKLIEIATFSQDGKGKDLYHGWILNCLNLASNMDAYFLLRQYAKLLKNLNKETMNTQILERFFEITKEKDAYQTALSIKSMLEELPEYFLSRTLNELKEKFNSTDLKYPFSDIALEDGSPSFIDWKPNDRYNFRISIFINESLLQKEFLFCFWDKNNEWDEGNGVIKKIYSEYLKENNKYKYTNNKEEGCSIRYMFSFPESIDQVYPVIKDFISTLSKLPKDLFEGN